MSTNYELVVGLETHVELLTQTKIFCGCPNAFGAESNTNCCPVCIGLPGTLPKLNREVVNFAIKVGLALNCEINLRSKMDRKNYVYPDLPKAYQISQYDLPICKNGFIQLSSGEKIRINRIHMEEDAGKLVHKAGDIYVDYNRGGVPLLEIVTEPDISTSIEAKEYVEKLQMVLRYIGVSDCKMQEGSMRCDVNVSIRQMGAQSLGTRTEIKNMNSITFMTKAIDYEYQRHVAVIESDHKIMQETLRYVEETGTTETMRGKEDAQDYRYFGDPDLVDIILNESEIENIKKSLPELPENRFKRYTEKFGIPENDALLLIKYKNVSDFFESSSQGFKNPKIISNFIVGQIFRNIETEADREKFNVPITTFQLNELALLVESSKLNMNLAKKALTKMLETGKNVKEFVSESDMQEISSEEIEQICKEAIDTNSAAVKDYLSGKEKALKSILGFVMKQTRGRGDIRLIEQKLIDLIKNIV